jgi:hypothetical protein
MMRTQHDNAVVIYNPSSTRSTPYELYRVEPSGLEMFCGYRCASNMPCGAPVITMKANIVARKERDEKNEAERLAHNARLAAMSDAELSAYHDEMFALRKR